MGLWGREENDVICDNCGVEVDCSGLCSPCQWLSTYGQWSNQQEAHRARLVRLTNRRWQMRFNRGEIMPLKGESERDRAESERVQNLTQEIERLKAELDELKKERKDIADAALLALKRGW